MKRGWKIFWIVIATIVVMGLIFCGAALVLGFRIHDLRKEYPNGIVLFGDDDMEWDDDPLENEYLNPEATVYDWKEDNQMQKAVEVLEEQPKTEE